jgi:hypothetical protein
VQQLELTINPNYVQNWGLWHAIRELLQNAMDAHDLGYPMTVNYDESRKTLSIHNEGISISRNSLLLGTTTKADDDNMRGKFGEGFKLAFIVLLRGKYPVSLKSGREIWTPEITYSSTYASDLMTINVAPCLYENCVAVFVENVPLSEWEYVCSRTLSLSTSKGINLGTSGIILTSEDKRGHLYTGGLWVNNLPGKYWFGYDLPQVTLDRDRQMADPWSLQSNIRAALNVACDAQSLSPNDLYTLFSGDWEESKIIADTFGAYNVSALAKTITEFFVTKYGDDTVPVEDMSQAISIGHLGIKGICVSPAIKKLIEFTKGKLEDRISGLENEVVTIHSPNDLSLKEQRNIKWLLNLLSKAHLNCTFNIVDFKSPKVLGLYRNGDIFISRKALRQRATLVSTLVHEQCHINGGDGTIEHVRAMEEVFGRLIAAK